MRNISVVVYRSMYSAEEVAIALLWNDNNIEDVPKSKDSSTMVVPLEQALLHIFILVMQNQEDFIGVLCGPVSTADSV
jgi:hypothetical protein